VADTLARLLNKRFYLPNCIYTAPFCAAIPIVGLEISWQKASILLQSNVALAKNSAGMIDITEREL
tara:strand:+ start:1536 stop:1733 length:198 start_codon:yes stop_codon:yes gene_type:complete